VPGSAATWLDTTLARGHVAGDSSRSDAVLGAATASMSVLIADVALANRPCGRRLRVSHPIPARGQLR
jgi:hypothetical protein